MATDFSAGVPFVPTGMTVLDGRCNILAVIPDLEADSSTPVCFVVTTDGQIQVKRCLVTGDGYLNILGIINEEEQDILVSGTTARPTLDGVIHSSADQVMFVSSSAPGGGVWRVPYHDCSIYTTCAECVARPPYCGWCLGTSTCGLSANCTQGFLAGSCPSISVGGPNSVDNLGGTSAVGVTLGLPSMDPDWYTGIYCSFSAVEPDDTPIANVTAIMNDDTHFICLLPDSGSPLPQVGVTPGEAYPQNTVLPASFKSRRQVSMFTAGNSLLAETNILGSLYVYDCTSLSGNCTVCQQYNDEDYGCVWCGDSDSCVYGPLCDTVLETCPVPTPPTLPTVYFFAPTASSASSQFTVEMTGINLDPDLSLTVTLGDDTIDIVSQTDTSLVVQLPVETVPGPDSLGLVFTLLYFGLDGIEVPFFTFYPDPILTDVEAASGPTTGGTAITLSGSNLLVPNGIPTYPTVTICEVPCLVYGCDADMITCVTGPIGSAQVCNVVLSIGSAITVLSNAYTYTNPPEGDVPVVVLNLPAVTNEDSQTNIAFYGTSLLGGSLGSLTSIRWNSQALTVISSNDTIIVARMPVVTGSIGEDVCFPPSIVIISFFLTKKN